MKTQTYYREEKTTGKTITVDIIWIASALDRDVTDTTALVAELAGGLVLENTIARFATTKTAFKAV